MSDAFFASAPTAALPITSTRNSFVRCAGSHTTSFASTVSASNMSATSFSSPGLLSRSGSWLWFTQWYMRWSYCFADSTCTGSICPLPCTATRTVRYCWYASRCNTHSSESAPVLIV